MVTSDGGALDLDDLTEKCGTVNSLILDCVILHAYRFKYRKCISTSDSHFPGSKTLEPVQTSDSSENVNT